MQIYNCTCCGSPLKNAAYHFEMKRVTATHLPHVYTVDNMLTKHELCQRCADLVNSTLEQRDTTEYAQMLSLNQLLDGLECACYTFAYSGQADRAEIIDDFKREIVRRLKGEANDSACV